MLAAAASAGPPFNRTFHLEGTDVIPDLCDVEGLDVTQDFVIDSRFQVGAKGSDGLAYFLQLTRHTEVITNLANDRFVTSVTPSVLEKDLRVTDNGEGTLTILVLATGNATIYGEDGKAIGRNPGQVRIELLLDHGGTPNDPNDDVLLSGPEVCQEVCQPWYPLVRAGSKSASSRRAG